MKCRKARLLMSAKLDGELSAEEAKALEGHLRVCPSCRREMEELERLHSLLGALPAEPLPLPVSEALLTSITSFTCEEARQAMHLALDGEISAEAKAILEAHLQRCEECAKEFEVLRRQSALLRALPKVEPPAELARLPRTEPVARPLPWVLRPAFAFSAAAVALILALGLFALRQEQKSVPEVAKGPAVKATEVVEAPSAPQPRPKEAKPKEVPKPQPKRVKEERPSPPPVRVEVRAVASRPAPSPRREKERAVRRPAVRKVRRPKGEVTRKVVAPSPPLRSSAPVLKRIESSQPKEEPQKRELEGESAPLWEPAGPSEIYLAQPKGAEAEPTEVARGKPEPLAEEAGPPEPAPEGREVLKFEF